MAVINLRLDDIEERQEFEGLPAGDYVVIVSATEVAETKKGTGYYVKATLDVVEGQFQKRKFWDYMNIKNQNEIAETIGKAKMKELCSACGITTEIQDTNEIHDIPLVMRLGMDKKGERIEVKRYIAYKDYQADEAEAKTETKAPAAAEKKTASRKPWEKPL